MAGGARVGAGGCGAVPELRPHLSARPRTPAELPQLRGRLVLGLGQGRGTGASVGRPEGEPVELR